MLFHDENKYSLIRPFFYFREEAGTYAGNPSSWDTKRGLKRTWNGEPVGGSSTQDSAQDRTSKPTSSEKGIVFINDDFRCFTVFPR